MDLKNSAYISFDVKTLAKELKSEYKLSDFEALTIALKAEQNGLLKSAFVVSPLDDKPTALEAIANALENR